MLSQKQQAVLQVSHMSHVCATLAVSIIPASWEVVCRLASHPAHYHFWVLKHHHSAETHHHLRRREMQLPYPWNMHACKANNNWFLYIFLHFPLYVFGIVFNCIIQNNSYCLQWKYFSVLLSMANASNNSSFSGWGVLPPACSKSMQSLGKRG